MKRIFRNISLVLGVILVTSSCDKNPDNAVYELVDDPEFGAVLRTLEIENSLLNSSDPNSAFVVAIEEQDEEDGALMESVDVYVTINDRTPDNGTTPPSEGLAKTIPASDFTTGPLGLPRATISVTFGEAVSAMGISEADYAAGDVFVIELRLNLTDGRVFGASSSSSVLSGLYFSSPYRYNTLVTCSPMPGDYLVKMFDSFGDGWQTDGGNGGNGITIDIDGTIVEIGMCSPYEASDYECTGPASTSFFDAETTVTIPEGAQSASWTFPGDQYGEIRFEVYSPEGVLVFDSGDFGETGAGLLPIVVCAN